MHTQAKILADSISDYDVRLTTWEVVFPRIILAETNTHRILSKNSASSRAIPVQKMIASVLEAPYVPRYWGKNQPGMQAVVEMFGEEAAECKKAWLSARDAAVKHARWLLDVGLHKQTVNRLLEPWMWHAAIISGTELDNFFHLRDHKDAHPDFRDLASAMRLAREESHPRSLSAGEWHLPLLEEDRDAFDDSDPAALPKMDGVKVSAGKCARVSYLTHDGRRDFDADISLCEGLTQAGHMSPLEHPARPATYDDVQLPGCRVHPSDVQVLIDSYRVQVDPEKQWHGNYRGWVQYRKTIPNEHDPLGSRS